MNRIYFELYSRSSKVTVYSIRFEGKLASETDVFVKEYLERGYLEEIQVVKRWLHNIEVRGASEGYFRPENNVSAGPVTFSKLRIYCIRCSHKVIILDGGEKRKDRKRRMAPKHGRP